jgi:hypothetical protein
MRIQYLFVRDLEQRRRDEPTCGVDPRVVFGSGGGGLHILKGKPGQEEAGAAGVAQGPSPRGLKDASAGSAASSEARLCKLASMQAERK